MTLRWPVLFAKGLEAEHYAVDAATEASIRAAPLALEFDYDRLILELLTCLELMVWPS